jgi:enoyl-CoA hydratase
MSYHTILTELVDGIVGVITLNRPNAANALNLQMGQELLSAVHHAEGNPAIRAIIITGAGEKVFCAGADLKERKGMNKDEWHNQHVAFEQALLGIMRCRKPVIGAVNGAAMGGGFELAMACDFIYASENARFALTEARLGIMPGMGGTQFLPRAIGTRRAKEALFLGSVFSASEAYAQGIVNRVCTPDMLLPSVMSTALSISGSAPLSVSAIKSAVDKGICQPIEQALKTELTHYNGLLETHDRHEGVNAFNEKRKPHFTGN